MSMMASIKILTGIKMSEDNLKTHLGEGFGDVIDYINTNYLAFLGTNEYFICQYDETHGFYYIGIEHLCVNDDSIYQIEDLYTMPMMLDELDVKKTVQELIYKYLNLNVSVNDIKLMAAVVVS
jgi:hypothetical protein